MDARIRDLARRAGTTQVEVERLTWFSRARADGPARVRRLARLGYLPARQALRARALAAPLPDLVDLGPLVAPLGPAVVTVVAEAALRTLHKILGDGSELAEAVGALIHRLHLLRTSRRRVRRCPRLAPARLPRGPGPSLEAEVARIHNSTADWLSGARDFEREFAALTRFMSLLQDGGPLSELRRDWPALPDAYFVASLLSSTANALRLARSWTIGSLRMCFDSDPAGWDPSQRDDSRRVLEAWVLSQGAPREAARRELAGRLLYLTSAWLPLGTPVDDSRHSALLVARRLHDASSPRVLSEIDTLRATSIHDLAPGHGSTEPLPRDVRRLLSRLRRRRRSDHSGFCPGMRPWSDDTTGSCLAAECLLGMILLADTDRALSLAGDWIAEVGSLAVVEAELLRRRVLEGIATQLIAP